jgi:peptide/nickel transport system ATP-binding protein
MSTAVNGPVMRAAGVRVELRGGSPVIDDVDLQIASGEILGLVGESGSGKTTTALALFGQHDRALVMSAGTIDLAGERLDSEERFRNARGRLVSYTPQNPGTALNPSLRIVETVEDMINAHRRGAGAQALSYQLFERVGLPNDRPFGRRYPHQLSGGQQQRVCIAASLAPQPALIVLDEPTTGLDVVTQDRILKELVRLRDEEDIAMLYITHDLAVVAQIASRIAVMYAGRLVEQGPAEEILRHPRHPYTRGLMAATPDHIRRRKLETMPGVSVGVGEWPSGCAFAPRCPQAVSRCEAELPELEAISEERRVRCFEWHRTPSIDWSPIESPEIAVDRDAGAEQAILEVDRLHAEYVSRDGKVVAADNISFAVQRGACVALVGESGSGKTTIGRAIAGLHPSASGQVRLAGELLPFAARKRSVRQRRRLQVIFQNPYQALNPRQTVAASIARPARTLRSLSRADASAEVRRLLEAVRLPQRVAARYPRELSGGERQRVAIARALAALPELIVCDEITSALDVSVQAVVLELLRELRAELGLALIFITHDLGVVSAVAERTLVLECGVICEQGLTAEVLASPQHQYTKRLLQAAPSLSVAIDAWAQSGAPADAPQALGEPSRDPRRAG